MSGHPILLALLVVFALCAVGALAALLYPFVLLYARRPGNAQHLEVRYHVGCSAIILFCALARAADLSFAGHVLNVVADVLVVVCAGTLVVFSFNIRPGALGATMGVLAAGAWVVGLLFCLLTVVLEGHSPVTVQLDDGLLCRETVYGLAVGDSGEVMDVYRRYLFIDHRILSQRHSDPEPETNTPPPPAMADALARCQARVNAARSNAGR